jgi:dynactin complex subunit
VEFSIQNNGMITEILNSCHDPANSRFQQCQSFNSEISPLFKDVTETITKNYTIDQENYLITIVPILLDLSEYQNATRDLVTNLMTLCLVYKEQQFIESVNEQTLITHEFIVNLVLFSLVLLFVFSAATFVSIQQSN